MAPASASLRGNGQTRRPLRQLGPAGLPYSRRLQRRGAFLRARDEGARFVGRLMILNVLPAPDGRLQFGAIASRRFERRATRRNRARRLLREAFRRLQARIGPPVWIVAVARHYLLRSSAGDVQAEMLQLLDRAGVLTGDGENA